MQNLRIFYDKNEPGLREVIKDVLEATGKFIVLLEKEEKSKTELPEKPIRFNDFSFDAKTRTLQWKEEEPVTITSRESKILLLLLEKAGTVVNRHFILTSFWGENSFYTSRSLDLFIYHIRKLLKQDPSVIIKTIRGEGFLLSY